MSPPYRALGPRGASALKIKPGEARGGEESLLFFHLEWIREKDCLKFEASLNYIVSEQPALHSKTLPLKQ